MLPGMLEKPFRVNVAQKLHLGGLWARFWCPQASISKGLGSIFSIFSFDFERVCRELAENLPSHTMPVSIADLLRPHDVRPRSSKGGGAAVVPPWGLSIE